MLHGHFTQLQTEYIQKCHVFFKLASYRHASLFI